MPLPLRWRSSFLPKLRKGTLNEIHCLCKLHPVFYEKPFCWNYLAARANPNWNGLSQEPLTGRKEPYTYLTVVITPWSFHSREQPPCSQSISWSPWWVKLFLSNSRDPFKTIGSVYPLIPVRTVTIPQNQNSGNKRAKTWSQQQHFWWSPVCCVSPPIFHYTDQVKCCKLEKEQKNCVIASK